MSKTEQPTDIYVGAVVEINKKPVNLVPNTPVNKIKDHGLKLSLDKPLDMGEFGDAMGSICKDLGVENEDLQAGKFPKTGVTFLDNVSTKVEQADVRLEALKYEKPPGESDKESKYVFVASANWPDDNDQEKDNEQEKDFFKLKGLIIGISKGYSDGDNDENIEVQKAFQSAVNAIYAPSQKALPEASDNGSRVALENNNSENQDTQENEGEEQSI